MVGYTPQIATAVWVGNVKERRSRMRDKNGQKIGGSTLPSDIWKQFMNAALKGDPVEQFQPAANIGDPDAGNAPERRSPTPPEAARGAPVAAPTTTTSGHLQPDQPRSATPSRDITPGGDAGGRRQRRRCAHPGGDRRRPRPERRE